MVNNVIKDTCDSVDHLSLAYIKDKRCFEEMACIFVLLILIDIVRFIYNFLLFVYLVTAICTVPYI